jgi:O-acetyl-ADP-ribose deacetylase (regulator of RNase III)
MKKAFGGATMEIVQGDITALAVEAIVNAANGYLQHGGGVAAAISRKGGPAIQRESDALISTHGTLKIGQALITGGGKLAARFVIHTVGPVWSRYDPAEADRLLCAAVRSSLALAEEKGLKSIAFPAISTGIYGFPMERAAPLLLQEAKRRLEGETGLERLLFCLYDDASYRVFESAFADI